MRIQRYILRQLLASTLAASIALFLFALPGVGVSAFAKLGAGGAKAAIGFVPFVFGEIGQYILPIGFLMAVVVTFGRLAADNEWLALTLTGMHPARVLWPVLGLALVLSAGHYPLAARLAPDLKVSQRQYLQESLVASLRNLSPGRTQLELGGFFLKAAERVGDTFYDVFVHVPGGRSGMDTSRSIRASSVRVRIEGDRLVIDFEDPVSMDGDEHYAGSHASLSFSSEELFGSKHRGFHMKLQYLRSSELEARIASGELASEDLRVARFELHNRRSSSLAYVLFVLWGLPVGLLAQRRSILSSFLLTIGFGIVYYVLSIRFLREAGYTGLLPPMLAAWATPVLGGGLGALLWRRGLQPRARG